MGFTLTEGHFTTEEEALAEIEARGWQAYTVDVPALENDFHWHDFSSVVFVLDGTPRVLFEDGTSMQCGRGARVEAPEGVVHRESSEPYRAVIGLSVDPATMTQPIDRPVAERV